jgi:guanylate kinase
MARFVILSGPSCIGKSPLQKALGRLYPDLAARLQAPVLYNSRDPRPGEVDGVAYHFRSREYLESLRGEEGYLVMDVRKDIQALAMADLQAVLDSGSDAFFEGNPYIAAALMKAPELQGTPLVAVFLSPLSREEIETLGREASGQVERIVADVMRRKLLRRTQKQKGILSLRDQEDIEARCGAAYRELGYAWQFEHVFPNHDGEDSENWDAFYFPLGDARKCLLDFVAILQGEEPRFAEKWDEGTIPG